MPPRSKTKAPISDDLVVDPSDHQRLFRLLPLHIFRKYTNIRKLITDEYETKRNKRPTKFYMNQELKKYLKMMGESSDWSGTILERLDFIWPKGRTKR